MSDVKTTPGEEPGIDSRSGFPTDPIWIEGLTLLVVAPILLFPDARPLLTLIALIWLGLVWLLPFFSSSQPNLPPTPLNLILLVWCITIIVGIAITADPDATLPKATGLILGLTAWRFSAIFLFTNRRIHMFLATMLLIAAGFTLLGLIGLDEVIKIPALAFTSPIQQLSLPGIEALEIHPNQLAGLICLYLPLVFSLLFTKPQAGYSGIVFVGLLLLAFLALAALIATQSRGGWVAALTGMFALVGLWGVILPPSRQRRLIRGVAIVCIILIVSVFLWAGPARIASFWLNPPAETVVGTLETLNYRRELWPWAITAIGDFPFTGTGLGSFREVAFRLYPLPLNPRDDIGHAHNIFLQTALDTGLPGLVAYIALLMVTVVIGWQISRRNPSLRPIGLGLLAGLFAFHIFGLADAIAPGAKPGLLFWLVIGLLTGMNRLDSRQRN